jgi:hypothetical protein
MATIAPTIAPIITVVMLELVTNVVVGTPDADEALLAIALFMTRGAVDDRVEGGVIDTGLGDMPPVGVADNVEGDVESSGTLCV